MRFRHLLPLRDPRSFLSPRRPRRRRIRPGAADAGAATRAGRRARPPGHLRSRASAAGSPGSATRLHIKTRAATIRRELLFQPGEPYDSARIAESERNLRALGVFRRVRIDTVRTDSGLVARVVTKDGWSTKADWRFRSTGGEVAFTIGLVEDNLLGTASSAPCATGRTRTASSVTLGFPAAPAVRRRGRAGAGLRGPLGRTAQRPRLEQPFYSLTSRRGFRIEAEDRDERVLRFFDGPTCAATR